MRHDTNRRVFIAGTAALMASPALAANAGLSLYVGTYTTKAGQGLYPLSLKDDAWTVGAPIKTIENTSFAVYSPRHQRYYVLNEKDDGRIDSYDTRWQRKNDVSSHGASPCYVSLSQAEDMLAVANYSTGNIAVYKLDPKTGNPLEPALIRQNTGHGPNADRQMGPHAHWVQFAPDQRHIYSVDLGTDSVLGYAYDAVSHSVGDSFVALAAPAGSGPRHLLFAPGGRKAYLVTEMGNTVHSLDVGNDGRLSVTQSLSTLPADFTAHSQAAHIAMNAAGDRLYVSNRGHNSIAVFALADGRLSLLQISPTLGDWPRFFLLLDVQKRLVVAHQNGNNLVVFTVNDDGTLMPKHQTIDVGAPVFIGISA